jgi:hypothetical protein
LFDRHVSAVLLLTLGPLATISTAPSAAAGQELGGFVVRASSPNPELPSPTGFGLYGEIEIPAGWIFHLAYSRVTDDVHKTGTVCQVYSPRIACDPEQVETSSQLGGLRLTVLRSLHLGDIARLGVGGGPSFNAVKADAVGETGRPADLMLPRSGQVGFHAALSASLRPLPSAPIRLTAAFSSHWIRFGGCAAVDDPTSGYDPFCGTDRFDELQLGAAYVLPRLAGW